MTLEELLDYCIRYSASIFVREEMEGKWDSYALQELPTRKALEHIRRWHQTGHHPVRVLAEGEKK